MTKDIPSIFGSMVFNEEVMKERLPHSTYSALKKTMTTNTPLDLEVANAVAGAMKDWAVEKGATHFTHWFQPLTGLTAEKHDSFITPTDGGGVIMEFSGKSLVRGEPDASSFPSGGLRATFEARGYTAWDPTSYAFIKDKTLCIPTAFCSYSGEALDEKTPLLRSMEALDIQTRRIVSLFGKTVKRVDATVGAEQEYFLVDKTLFEKRPDLKYCGRTLLGAAPAKGQIMEDHYFGAIKPRVSAFMSELDEELWKLGIPAKTEHNEAAPAQHELAPVFSVVNISTDHNQLTMELMRQIAKKHGMECLLHEKPFATVNGSGKHNNWSLSTDTGENLLEPGATPYENARFLLFLTAVIEAVDEYQDLLRASVASAGNDHRLGAAEAPPAIISIYLGDELTGILDAIVNGTSYKGHAPEELEIGATVLPRFPKDTTDRNRTSPFAFTGNKFELRMVGASASVSAPNTMLNTMVAEVLKNYADRLEIAGDFKTELSSLIKESLKKHSRIVFNGNNYSGDWHKEAERRGLFDLPTTADALPRFIVKKNIELMKKHGVLSEEEMHSRYEIQLENYVNTVKIESLVLLNMARRDVVSAVISFEGELAQLCEAKRKLGGFSERLESSVLDKVSRLADIFTDDIEELEDAIEKLGTVESKLEAAEYCRDRLLPAMNRLRSTADELETSVGSKYWPYPIYEDLLYSV